MNRPRLILGLRIAWSVWWGILCVLLIGLWVRSYSVAHSFHYVGSQFAGIHPVTVININPGVIEFGRSKAAAELVGPDICRWIHITRTNPDIPTRSFEWFWTGEDFVVQFPIWLSAVLVAGVGVISWLLPWKFSLRTLLIVTTAIAVTLGLVVYATR